MTSKVCASCNIRKDEDAFYFHSKGSGKRRADCKPCTYKKHSMWIRSNWESHLEHCLKSGRKFKYTDKYREWYYWSRYKLTLDQYKKMLAAQGGRCFICNGHEKRYRGNSQTEKYALAVDHDHKTGKVRGLLCRYCNQMIGVLEARGLKKVARYLGYSI